MAQGTLRDPHGHPNGPLQGPCDFSGSLGKKGPPLQGLMMVKIHNLTIDKIEFTAWIKINLCH